MKEEKNQQNLEPSTSEASFIPSNCSQIHPTMSDNPLCAISRKLIEKHKRIQNSFHPSNPVIKCRTLEGQTTTIPLERQKSRNINYGGS